MEEHALLKHLTFILSGATATGIVAHAVNTFPTPKNIYSQWFLGLLQFIVGQRTIAKNTFNGYQTDAHAVMKIDESKQA